MKDRINRLSFLKIVGMSLGVGVVYQFAPILAQLITNQKTRMTVNHATPRVQRRNMTSAAFSKAEGGRDISAPAGTTS